MNRIIIHLNLNLISRLIGVRLFLELNDSLPRVVLQKDHISGGVSERLVLAIEFFLVTAPWIPVRTYQVVPVASVRIVEHVAGFLYLVYVAYSYADPWGQFDYSHAPFLDWHCFWYYEGKLTWKAGLEYQQSLTARLVHLGMCRAQKHHISGFQVLRKTHFDFSWLINRQRKKI